ncbi:hypothetical protein C4K68_09650 [Pokkaliibacter plantistimulans]|uniref:Plasmid segregation protein ParM/StbA N-terminal domain-containing protein n=1 Tax=Proteobacteria bacterium 228 TaxID=2083153 RepID=A0A2S5KSC1_9PROT|nr:ParM/StbA family protein [Pokkaliibacter plantistimulans]PPC77613.1 hypothetical protein C4K68_09650 [Pokkaliibacter plantistimulans]
MITLVATDNGNAVHKIVYRADELIVRHSEPTLICQGQGETTDDGLYIDSYIADGEIYSVSTSLPAIQTRNDEFHKAPYARVLVHHALVKSGLAGKKVALVTGLPFNRFYLPDGKRNEVVIQEQIDNLMKPVLCANSQQPLVEVVSVGVIAEGKAASFTLLFNMDGEEKEGVSTDLDTMVWDIGGSTTDIVTHSANGNIIMSRSGTEKVGGIDILNNATQLLTEVASKAVGRPMKLSRRQVEQAISSGELSVPNTNPQPNEGRTKVLNVQEQVRSSIAPVLSQIRQLINTRSQPEGAHALLVGGGAQAYAKYLEDLPLMLEIGGPYTNAEGMWIWGACSGFLKSLSDQPA